MGLLLAVVVFAWLIAQAVKDARLDHAYAQQGLVSPRLQARYGGADRARALVARYGFFDYLRDAWRDYWPRRTQALIAARNARSGIGGRPRWTDRFRAARHTITKAPVPPAAPTRRPRGPNLPADPVGAGTAAPAPGAGPPAAEPSTNPPAPTEPEQASDSAAAPMVGDETTEAGSAARPQLTPASAPTAPTKSAFTDGGTGMTATGEAINYETALATLDEMIADTQVQIDAAKAALESLAQTKSNVEAMQITYAGQAAATKLDHETAMNLDATTLAHAGTTVDALPVGAVDNLYEAVEQTETLTTTRLEQAETALASLEAEREHLIATYADAHATVAGNLGGDARFLDSGGGVAAAPTPATAA